MNEPLLCPPNANDGDMIGWDGEKTFVISKRIRTFEEQVAEINRPRIRAMKIGQLCEVQMPFYDWDGKSEKVLSSIPARCRVVSSDAETVCVIFEASVIFKDGLMKFFPRSEVKEIA